jgi:hypothetical protein
MVIHRLSCSPCRSDACIMGLGAWDGSVMKHVIARACRGFLAGRMRSSTGFRWTRDLAVLPLSCYEEPSSCINRAVINLASRPLCGFFCR